jgi:hypothetical protein
VAIAAKDRHRDSTPLVLIAVDGQPGLETLLSQMHYSHKFAPAGIKDWRQGYQPDGSPPG